MLDRIKVAVTDMAHRFGYALIPNWRIGAYSQATYLRRLIEILQIDCIFDVGANVGQYHDFLRMHVGYRGVIVSFEPIPGNIRVLQEKSRHDERWIIEGYALGRSPGTATFNVMANPVFSSFLEPDHSAVGIFSAENVIQKAIVVEVKNLDQVFAELELRIPFSSPYLKLDTQGFDLEVLNGASNTIGRFKALQTEASIKPIYVGMPDFLTTIETVRELGFEVSGIFPTNDAAFPLLVEIDCHMVSTACLAELSR